jgi:hypothetical protein
VLKQLRRLLAADSSASDAELARGLNRWQTEKYVYRPRIAARHLPELRARLGPIRARPQPAPTPEELKEQARTLRQERRRIAAMHPVAAWDPKYRRLLTGELRRYRRREGRVVALAEMVAAANRFHARHARGFTGLPPDVTAAHVRDLLADLRVPNAKTVHPEKPKGAPGQKTKPHAKRTANATATRRSARARRRAGGTG